MIQRITKGTLRATKAWTDGLRAEDDKYVELDCELAEALANVTEGAARSTVLKVTQVETATRPSYRMTQLPCGPKPIRTISGVFGINEQIRIRISSPRKLFLNKFEFLVCSKFNHTHHVAVPVPVHVMCMKMYMCMCMCKCMKVYVSAHMYMFMTFHNSFMFFAASLRYIYIYIYM